MRFTVFSILSVALSLSSSPKPIDLGPLALEKPPGKEELVPPGSGVGARHVGIRALVGGELKSEKKGNVYILVCPVSNSAVNNTWWVQRPVSRDGDAFTASCQFGEVNQGDGEYFVMVAIVTTKTFRVGQRLAGIPPAVAYTKAVFVKRR